MNIDKIVAAYMEVREERDQLIARHKKELEPYTETLAETEQLLLGLLNETGANSVKTPHGTAYISTVDNLAVKNWEEALEYIRKNERWALLTKKLTKTEAEDGEMIPGTELTRIRKLNVRRT